MEKKIEELRAANVALVELAKTEKRELSASEKEVFEARNEVIAFYTAKPAETETRSAPPSPAVAPIVVAEVRTMETAREDKGKDAEARAIVSALTEKRAIAIGSNGDSSFSSKVFEIPGDLTNILNRITIESNAAPNTKFPLFSPNLDQVVRVSEDGTSSVVATTAFAPVTVTPSPYLAYCPISDSFLKQNPSGVVGKLGSHFNKAFLRKMAYEVVFGTGSGAMLGVFKDTGITATATTAATGVPKMVDLIALIAKLTGKFLRSELTVLINPAYWANIMAEDTYRTHVTLTNGVFYFDGVMIIENDNAPTTLTVGSIVAVIGNFTDYGVAQAQTVEMENISKVAGSLNSNIQGVAYFDGKAIVPASFAVLKTKAQT